jgi:protein CpxP
MKKLLLIGLTLGLLASFTYAQMGGGMMGGQKGEMGGGMMGGQQGQMGSGMMQGQQMMGGMMQNINQMSGIMQKMSEVINKMDASRMNEMSGIMEDISKQMMNMSLMMKKGKVSQEEMQNLRREMMDTEKTLNMMTETR